MQVTSELRRISESRNLKAGSKEPVQKNNVSNWNDKVVVSGVIAGR